MTPIVDHVFLWIYSYISTVCTISFHDLGLFAAGIKEQNAKLIDSFRSNKG